MNEDRSQRQPEDEMLKCEVIFLRALRIPNAKTDSKDRAETILPTIRGSIPLFIMSPSLLSTHGLNHRMVFIILGRDEANRTARRPNCTRARDGTMDSQDRPGLATSL